MTEPAPPDDPTLADGAADLRGAYVHIPFCARVCPYCDFAVVAGRDDAISRYIDAVLAEVEMEPTWGALDAVHFGGGTPSVLSADALSRIAGALAERFGLSRGAEMAIEANPEDWSDRYAQRLLEAGFDRVSFGVQSFDPDVLRSLGRRHDVGQAERAVAGALRSGFRSVSLDLIYGTPGESMESWRMSVAQAVGLGAHHLSTYALTVERGTELGRLVAAGAPAPDPDGQASKWEAAAEAASAAGMVRYETSNFARPGHPSRYNLLTWAQGEYVAFGTGAHGHRDGVRRRNVRKLDAYLDRVERGVRPEAGRDRHDAWGREQERVMLGLRRAAGVLSGDGGAALLASAWGARLVASDVLVQRAGRIRVERPLLGDEAVRAVLALKPGDC